MTDIYDSRGNPIEWELDDLPGPTVEQLNAVIDRLNAVVTRLQRECAAHEQALTMVEEENEKLRVAATDLINAVRARDLNLAWAQRIETATTALQALLEAEA